MHDDYLLATTGVPLSAEVRYLCRGPVQGGPELGVGAAMRSGAREVLPRALVFLYGISVQTPIQTQPLPIDLAHGVVGGLGSGQSLRARMVSSKKLSSTGRAPSPLLSSSRRKSRFASTRVNHSLEKGDFPKRQQAQKKGRIPQSETTMMAARRMAAG
ncbi:unnamed protein product [Prorocentrum cordatum]|uniref:Uncharacterized protein n=1 Tax=Prorocentrum cordatum TaxID=2364126 RepID=A0ABN9Q3B7_9DINO|nr:unnamed protein product [Polarella glacialis]